MPKRKRKEVDGSKNKVKFKGVQKIGKGFRAKIHINGQQQGLGTFATPKEAAKAYDLAAIQARRPTSKLNFLDQVPKNYKPKKKKLSSTNTTGYRGVRKDRNRYKAAFYVDGKRNHLGSFVTVKEAAIAWDLAAIQAKLSTSLLNFPDMIHIHVEKKIPKRKKKKLVTCIINETSFNGVFKIGEKFRAEITISGEKKNLGIFTKGRDAAIAYDTAIVELSGNPMDELNSQLNFPNGTEKVVEEEEL